MSNTIRNIPNLERFDKPWQTQKLGLHKSMGRKEHGIKYHIGIGGLNCPCCTRMPPEKLKVMSRRTFRHKQNESARNMKYEVLEC